MSGRRLCGAPSSATGIPCRANAMKGYDVCYSHASAEVLAHRQENWHATHGLPEPEPLGWREKLRSWLEVRRWRVGYAWRVLRGR